MIPVEDLGASNLEFKNELVQLANEAESFIMSHGWCKKIVKAMFDRGWGYTLSIFYFEIEGSSPEVPNSVWVVVGDLPPAYIDVEDNPNGACALEGYVLEMQDWVDNVLEGKPLDDVIPVNVPPTKKYADMLSSRLDFIKQNILSQFENELSEGRK